MDTPTPFAKIFNLGNGQVAAWPDHGSDEPALLVATMTLGVRANTRMVLGNDAPRRSKEQALSALLDKIGPSQAQLFVDALKQAVSNLAPRLAAIDLALNMLGERTVESMARFLDLPNGTRVLLVCDADEQKAPTLRVVSEHNQEVLPFLDKLERDQVFESGQIQDRVGAGMAQALGLDQESATTRRPAGPR